MPFYTLHPRTSKTTDADLGQLTLSIRTVLPHYDVRCGYVAIVYGFRDEDDSPVGRPSCNLWMRRLEVGSLPRLSEH